VPQEDPLPYVTTSISGITPEDWDAFKERARQEGITYRAALYAAFADLTEAIEREEKIDWKAIKVAPSRPIKVDCDLRDEVRVLGKKLGYRQNVILATAMHRWASKL
jgi:hypothetical protein